MKIFTLSLLLFPLILFAQTGPGGIGDNTTNVLWLDAHTMNLGDGAAVSSWTDYSGNAANAAQGSLANQPTVVAGAVNGRDAFNFNGSQFMTTDAIANLNSAPIINWYVFADIHNPTILSIPFNVDYGSINAEDAFTGFISQSGTQSVYGRAYYNSLFRSHFSASSGFNVYQGIFNDAANTGSSFLNFTANNVNTNFSKTTPATNEGCWIGGKSGAYNIDGQISEIFVFTTILNLVEETILQNYVNAKFGTTIATDLYTLDGTYGLGVIGIGQASDGTSHTDSQGNGVVRINTPSGLTNDEYLFVGHDDVDLSALSFEVPGSLVDAARFERVWRAEETGDVGTVTLIFDLGPSTDFSADPANYRLLIDDDGDFSSIPSPAISGTYNASENSITFTGIDLNTGDYFTLAGDAPQEIHSITSGDWNETDTWDCGCIPTAYNDVYIDPFNVVTMDIDNGEAYNLTVEVNGELQMHSEFDITLIGGFDIIGTVDLLAGGIVFNGTEEQYIDGGGNPITINNLTVNNSSGLPFNFFESEYTVNGTLSFLGGDIAIPGATTLIINSTSATTTGRVGPIDPGTSISGNVTVRRFIAAGNTDWRDICSPVAGADLSMWDASIEISGPGFPDGCAYDSTCFHSVVYWENGTKKLVTDPTFALTSGRGFEVFIGDDLSSFSGATLEVTGTLNGPSDFVYSAPQVDWYTFGNPFASPILYKDVTKASVGKYFYVYDPATGGYQWYDELSASSSTPELADGKLAIGQAFWSKGPGSLTFPQACKTDQTATFFRAAEETPTHLNLVLTSQTTTYMCLASIDESYETTDGYDDLIDIPHLEQPNTKASSIAFISEDEIIRKNYIEKNFRDKKFDLYTNFLYADYYEINAENIENFDGYNHVYLIDNYENEKVDLKVNPNYVFWSEVDSTTTRFTLILTNAAVSEAEVFDTNDELNNQETAYLSINQTGNMLIINSEIDIENSEITLYNVYGQQVNYNKQTSLVKGDNLVTLPDNFDGVYIVTIRTGEDIFTKKIVL